jgi:hypothetical protein
VKWCAGCTAGDGIVNFTRGGCRRSNLSPRSGATRAARDLGKLGSNQKLRKLVPLSVKVTKPCPSLNKLPMPDGWDDLHFAEHASFR